MSREQEWGRHSAEEEPWTQQAGSEQEAEKGSLVLGFFFLI